MRRSKKCKQNHWEVNFEEKEEDKALIIYN